MRLSLPLAFCASLGAIAALASCSHAPLARSTFTEEGEASFYGPRFEGKRTASGQRFDPRALTCAHRTLPFGTKLKVVDLDTGRSAEVVVTDRGPYVRGRIVDLSAAAAAQLGIRERGRARVRLEVLP